LVQKISLQLLSEKRNCSPVFNGFVPGFVLAVDGYEHEWENNDTTNVKEIGLEDSDCTEIRNRFC